MRVVIIRSEAKNASSIRGVAGAGILEIFVKLFDGLCDDLEVAVVEDGVRDSLAVAVLALSTINFRLFCGIAQYIVVGKGVSCLEGVADLPAVPSFVWLVSPEVEFGVVQHGQIIDS